MSTAIENRSPRQSTPLPLRPYKGVMCPLTEEEAGYFNKRYGVTRTASWMHIDNASKRYVLPIFGPLAFESSGNVTRGHVLRVPWKDAPARAEGITTRHPKAETFMHERMPAQSFYRPKPCCDRNEFLIVEDQLSAMKAAEYGFTAVALLGKPLRGGISSWRLEELARVAGKHPAIIALDADATWDAFMFAFKHRSLFRGGLRVVPIDKDLKDTPFDEWGEVLRNVRS